MTVLVGADGGRYPAGNTVLVRGSDSSLLIDPSTSMWLRDELPGGIDRIVLTHVHEDHVAGIARFPEATVTAHEFDVHGVRSLDGLMSIYGMDEAAAAVFRPIVERDFHFVARPEATGFPSGHRFDLGGVTVTAVHLPGHTRGHTGFLVEPDGVFVLGDIDLSAFGPYYGDAWSDLDDFERSLSIAAGIEARWYVTFHHRGVIEGRDAFLPLLDAFTGVIATREQRMVEFLAEPRTLQELVDHRFVYRPHVTLPFVPAAEKRSAELSLARLIRAGRVVEAGTGYVACG